MSKVASARASQNHTARSVAPIPFTLRQLTTTAVDDGEVSSGMLLHFRAKAETRNPKSQIAYGWRVAVSEGESNLNDGNDTTAAAREFQISLTPTEYDHVAYAQQDGDTLECGGMTETELRAFFGMFDTLRSRMRAAGLEV